MRFLQSLLGRAANPKQFAPSRRRLEVECLEQRKLLAAGDLDVLFSGDGRELVSFRESGGLDNRAQAVAIQSDGKLVVAGFADGGLSDFAVARLNPDGSLDTSFSGDGRQSFTFGAGEFGGVEKANAVALQPDGKIVVAGFTDAGATVGHRNFAVARLNTDGSLDTSFDVDGRQILDFSSGLDSVATSVTILPDGMIVIAGFTVHGSDNFMALAQLRPDGSVVHRFSYFGLGDESQIMAVAGQSDGKIVFAGFTDLRGDDQNDILIMRLDASLGDDATFDGNGIRTIDLGADDRPTSIAIQPDGKIVLGGFTDAGASDFAVARLNTDGSSDTSFGVDGKSSFSFGTNSIDKAYSLALQSDGKILLAGTTDAGGGGSNFALARLTADGRLDASFDGDGKQITDFGGQEGAHGIAVQADRKIVVVGFSGFESPGRSNFNFAIARYESNSPPVANNDVYVLGASAGPLFSNDSVFSNDFDADGDTIRLVTLVGTRRGVVSISPKGRFDYTKFAGFRGVDRFGYTSADVAAIGSDATVTLLSHEASIVRKLYLQVLSREPEDAGIEFWAERISSGAGYGRVAEGIFESDERLNPIIRQYYRDYLLREADDQGLAYWRDQIWKRDGGPENVVAGMIGSPEFFQSAGGTNRGWVTELYRRLLDREPEPSGLEFWLDALDQRRLTREQVVLGFVRSDENFGNLIDGWYESYLGRQPAALERDAALAQMRGGASHRQIQIGLFDGFEYRNSPPPPAAGFAVRLP